jgi:hypothetical protein
MRIRPAQPSSESNSTHYGECSTVDKYQIKESVLHLREINIININVVLLVHINLIMDVVLGEFYLCKTVYDNIT